MRCSTNLLDTPAAALLAPRGLDFREGEGDPRFSPSPRASPLPPLQLSTPKPPKPTADPPPASPADAPTCPPAPSPGRRAARPLTRGVSPGLARRPSGSGP